MDWIPILSQTKSLFQVICGDAEGARQTQENFLKTCPVVSQGTSFVQSVILDDDEAARKTQIEFGKTMSGVADGIPVVGHVKGVIHYACGDREGGDQAMKSSSRTVGVIGGGVGGFFIGGPVGAVAGGIAGGSAMDGITTAIDSAVHDEYRPAGHIATVTDIVTSSKNPAGKIFDLAAGVAFDGLTGNAAGKAAGQIARNIKANQIRANAAAAFEMVDPDNPATTSGQLAEAGQKVMSEMKRADAVQGVRVEFSKMGEASHVKPPVIPEPTFAPVNEATGEAESTSEKQNGQPQAQSQKHQSSGQKGSQTDENNNETNRDDGAPNNPNNNNNNNNNNNSNSGTGTRSATAEARRQQVRDWFNSLNTGIPIREEHELDRLVQVRNDLDGQLGRFPTFLQHATGFAVYMIESHSTVNHFCAFLKFFEEIFFQMRGALQDRSTPRAPIRQAGENALTSMIASDYELVRTYYAEAVGTVHEGNMVYERPVDDPSVQIDMPESELTDLARQRASSGGGIRMGSVESATYHMLTHSVNPLRDYVARANQIIATGRLESFVNRGTYIDVTFVEPTTGNRVVILIKNGTILLKTFIPKTPKHPIVKF